MGRTSALFLVGSASALMVCAAFGLGIYVGRATAPAAATAASATAPPPTIRPVVVPAPQPAPQPSTARRDDPSRSPAARESAPRPVPADAGITVPDGARRAIGLLRPERAVTLLRAPAESAEQVADVPSGAHLEVVGALGGYALVTWGGGTNNHLTYGWVQVPEHTGGHTGTLTGHVRYPGAVPSPDRSAAKRKDAEVCKEKNVSDAPVSVQGGMLRDVFVRLTNVEGVFEVPAEPAVVDQIDCTFVPRVLGAMSGQELRIRNSDGTLHNVHAYKGGESIFNQAQPKQSPAIEKEAPDDGIMELACDIHPWMKAYVVVSGHPLFAVTGEGGAFRIPGVPPGRYEVEAWHPTLGKKAASATIADDQDTTLDITFSTATEKPAPREGGGDKRIGF